MAVFDMIFSFLNSTTFLTNTFFIIFQYVVPHTNNFVFTPKPPRPIFTQNYNFKVRSLAQYSEKMSVFFFNWQWKKKPPLFLSDIMLYMIFAVFYYFDTKPPQLIFTLINNSSLLFNFTYNLLCRRWVFVIDIFY